MSRLLFFGAVPLVITLAWVLTGYGADAESLEEGGPPPGGTQLSLASEAAGPGTVTRDAVSRDDAIEVELIHEPVAGATAIPGEPTLMGRRSAAKHRSSSPPGAPEASLPPNKHVPNLLPQEGARTPEQVAMEERARLVADQDIAAVLADPSIEKHVQRCSDQQWQAIERVFEFFRRHRLSAGRDLAALRQGLVEARIMAGDVVQLSASGGPDRMDKPAPPEPGLRFVGWPHTVGESVFWVTLDERDSPELFALMDLDRDPVGFLRSRILGITMTPEENQKPGSRQG